MTAMQAHPSSRSRNRVPRDRLPANELPPDVAYQIIHTS